MRAMRILLPAFALVALTACIEPPGESTNAPTPGGAPGVPGEGGAPTPGQPPGEGGGEGGGPLPGGEAPPWSTEIETAQDAFGEDAVSLAGNLTCSEGSGPFYVYVMPPPPEEGEADNGPPIAVTSAKVEGPGDFTLKVPAGRDVVVLGFEDADDDGAPSEGGIFFHDDGSRVSTDGGATLSLDCLNLAAPPEGTPMAPEEAPEPGVQPEDLPPAPAEGGEGAPQPTDGALPPADGPPPASPEGGAG